MHAVQANRAAVSSQASSEEAAAKLLHANTLTARQREEIADLRRLNMQLFTSLETLRVQLGSAEQRCSSQELAGEPLTHPSSWIWTAAGQLTVVACSTGAHRGATPAQAKWASYSPGDPLLVGGRG